MNPLVDNLILFTGKLRGDGFQKLNKGIMTSHKSLFSLRNMFGAFFGYDLYTSFRNLIPQITNTSQQLGAMKSRFNAVSTSASAGADELNWIGEQSKRLGLDFLKTADDYSIFFATVSKNMGQGQTRQVFEQWAEAFRVLHIDPERQSRVLYALREMSSKGKIYMQDLALQLGSAVPDAMNLAAKSMGYTGPKAVERFRQAIKDGAIDVKKFIPAFSEIINKQYVSADKLTYAMGQTDAQLQLINTHWQFMQKKLLESGMQDDIVNFLKGTNKLLGFLEKHSGGLYKSLKLITKSLLLIGAGAGLFKLFNLFKDAKLAFQVMAMAKGFSQMGMAIKTIQAAAIASEIGSGAGIMGILIGALTNPWVLAIVLISSLTLVLGWVLKKFFPNVWVKIVHYFYMFKRWMWNLLNDINNHPAIIALTKWFKMTGQNIGTGIKESQQAGGFFRGNLEISSPVMPQHPARDYIGGMRLTRQGFEKVPQGGPPINISKIDASIHIDGTGIENPQQAAEAVKIATESSYSKVMREIFKGIPGSKNKSFTPF